MLYKYNTFITFYKHLHNIKLTLEVLANSDKSWEEATKKAVKQASKSVKNIKSVFVQSQSAVVKDDEVTEFRVNLKITFEVN